MKTRFRLIPAAVFGLCLASSGIASAQSGSMFTGGALQGANGFSTGTTGSATFGGGRLGSQGGASNAFGSGAQAAGSMSTQGLMNAQGNMSSMLNNLGGGQGQAGQGNGFLGQSNNNSDGRLFGAAQGQRQGQGQFGQQNRNQFNQRNRNQQNRNRNNNQNFQNQNFMNQGGGGSQAAQRVIRPQQRIAFTFTRPAPVKLVATLTQRFEKLSKLAGRTSLNGVTVAAEGDTIRLSGQVENDEARKLAAMLASLEPGVRSIQNDLTVASAPSPAGE